MEHEITYSALIVTSVKTLFALERHKIEYKNVYNPNLLNELQSGIYRNMMTNSLDAYRVLKS